ncbi:Ankyrin repeat and MYND domain-containing protein 2 [Halotydeus destructor]|nr:Ankyrin repeat and MYND domain-containing protein 2 [Halotydeus destructor]
MADISENIAEISLDDSKEALFKGISDRNLAEVELALKNASVKINCQGVDGMSPLQTAAFKGDFEICKLLIDRGADVNYNKHVHGYTALMFAALGGHNRLVSLMLENGASTTAVNSVGRTASQMAAFVGQHQAVTIINNFVSREEIEYYSKPQGLEKKAKLTSQLVEPVHKLVRQTNIHPVKTLLFMKDHPAILENSGKVRLVLEMMCENEMKKEEPNEMLALKFHHLGFLLKHITKQFEIMEKAGKEKSSWMELLMKSWLKGRDEDAFPITLEQLLRQSIKEFPHRDCTIFIQLVKTLSSVQIGEEPSAISILMQTVNGQKGFNDDAAVCSTCGEPGPPKKCSICRMVQYCNQECQKLHWFSHKKVCQQLKEMVQAEAAANAAKLVEA